MTPTMPELKRITEVANEYRQQLVAPTWGRNFPGVRPTPWPPFCRPCSPPV
jgi:hypothetical protein